MVRFDPTPAARTLIAALPRLIEQAEAAGGALRLGVYGMRTALAEAQAVIDAADRPRMITSAGEMLRRLGK